jgi:hypothetical protein
VTAEVARRGCRDGFGVSGRDRECQAASGRAIRRGQVVKGFADPDSSHEDTGIRETNLVAATRCEFSHSGDSSLRPLGHPHLGRRETNLTEARLGRAPHDPLPAASPDCGVPDVMTTAPSPMPLVFVFTAADLAV